MSNRVGSKPRQSVACYFCNDFLEDKYLLDHVKQCGSVLEECPLKCGVYVPRRNMEDHRENCNRGIVPGKNQSRGVQDILWRNKVHAVLSFLRSMLKHEEIQRETLQEDMSRCLSLLNFQEESVDSLRRQVLETTRDSQRYNVTFGRRLNDLETMCDNIEQRTIVSFERISEQLSLLQDELIDKQNKQDRVPDNWDLTLEDIKIFVAKESLRVNKIWLEQQQLVHNLKLKLENGCSNLSELIEQQENVIERIRNLEDLVEKQSSMLDAQENNLNQLKIQINENVEHLEELIKEKLRTKSPESLYCNCKRDCMNQYPTNGRLLWRIDSYSEKLADAKKSDCAIYSKRFSNNEYGYTLRIELFLNGIGKWKGRHIIGCLRVEPGEWDPLLDWPCILKATVTLRNQENPRNDIRKLVKAVGHEKSNLKDTNKDPGIYMFIPHTTIERYSGFVKDDTLFVDVQVKDIMTHASMSSLSL